MSAADCPTPTKDEVRQLGAAVDAARAVVAITDTPTTYAGQDEHLARLRVALAEAHSALAAVHPAAPESVQGWAELQAAVAPFLQLACDRLARRSWEPVSDEACRRLLRAFSHELPATPEGKVRHG
ncbi:hypothetical protein D187_007486 [Cystobacter fuscus DSM 2262]|uniref:Uncharacterized protein n=1 Tax=Cystobacter fuscus (strain ATCC 25194 / DSM 2262 / NBRC 100088 / M29) TaxID=1242864 RepID=S9Q4C0_CYSF2|nr:hypothetical protein [Cystobacter fuscus]EPX56144.1 hypothetical protein D187_007486 [Cystobacter fuscus DSM 2262]